MKISFYVNESKERARAARAALVGVARRSGLEVVEAGAEVLVVLGGDGTMLRSVHEFPDVPVLGFNLGSLGYLASVEERDFELALAALAAGRFRLSERSLIEVRREGRPEVALAFNDVVLMRGHSGHAALIDLTVDGGRPTRHLADGLIFATPAGSTAYSLSAGGPVLLPSSRSFVVTPLNPHALGIRPMVVGDTAVFRATPVARDDAAAEEIGVYADGEAFGELKAGETALVRRAERVARVVELSGYDPQAVLAAKLGWSGSCVR